MIKNDKKANILIIGFSVIVFLLVAALGTFKKPGFNLPFNPHIFAQLNAIINTLVSILLIVALVFIKKGNFLAHKNSMLAAMCLSILFLLSYVLHHF